MFNILVFLFNILVFLLTLIVFVSTALFVYLPLMSINLDINTPLQKILTLTLTQIEIDSFLPSITGKIYVFDTYNPSFNMITGGRTPPPNTHPPMKIFLYFGHKLNVLAPSMYYKDKLYYIFNENLEEKCLKKGRLISKQ